MRLVTVAVTLLTTAAFPVSANEAFIAQLTSKAEQSAANPAKTMLSAAMLALPVQPKTVNSPVANATNATANTSSVLQVGTNNVAAVSQTGSGNASSIVQHGNGNQATMTQRH